MKILIAHTHYQQAGGEDSVVSEEISLLGRQGHEVQSLLFNNDNIRGFFQQIGAVADAYFSPSSYIRALKVIREFQPDILHVHNFFPTMSPAIFYAAHKTNVPVVLTLHNFRLICANGILFREGKVCEDCPTQHSFLPGVKHACYRDSSAGSAVVGSMAALHAVLGTWSHKVNRYIALTSFAASRLVPRIPKDRISIKPNFIADRNVGRGDGGFALFTGRLTEEKGLATLIQADSMGLLPIPVHIVGDGPMRSSLEAAAARTGSQLRLLGAMSRDEVAQKMRGAVVLLVPSIWYEGFPMVVVEALATGLPVVGSRIGSLAEILEEDITGSLHEPNDALSLIAALDNVLKDPAKLAWLRVTARHEFDMKYSEVIAYRNLMAIYNEVISETTRSAAF